MDEHKVCLRCQGLNEVQNRFCWQCGINLAPDVRPLAQEAATQEAAAAKRATNFMGVLASILAGALGGIVVGALIVIAMILSFVNAIFEMLDSCGAALLFLSVMFTTIAYSLVSLFF